MSEDVETNLETRFLQFKHEMEKLASDRISSLEKRIESVEVKTNKLLGFLNDLEERMLEIDRQLTRLKFQKENPEDEGRSEPKRPGFFERLRGKGDPDADG